MTPSWPPSTWSHSTWLDLTWQRHVTWIDFRRLQKFRSCDELAWTLCTASVMYSIMTFFVLCRLCNGSIVWWTFCTCYVYGSLKSASRTVINVIHTRLIHTYVIQQFGLCEAWKLDNPYTLISIPVYRPLYGYWKMIHIAPFAQTHRQRVWLVLFVLENC